ncbi:hypothetical protein SAMN04487950_2527 [Halogranum rubrum]|uniref:Uncharacterized protein n=1 Tax=Halogranum rubrum TaxID=553466 RepID=A0A1I4EZW7_9EURY|nr:hypothetical protein [Halogranum rubrum]SFL11248.1 hypothetical protein SAMN04487950_2527 [Halogranum rubrum]
MLQQTLVGLQRRLSPQTRRRVTGVTAILGALLFGAAILWQAIVDLGEGGDEILIDIRTVVATISGGTLVAAMALLCVAALGTALAYPTATDRYWQFGVLSTVGGFALSVVAALVQLLFVAVAPSLVPAAGIVFGLGGLGTILGALPMGIGLWRIADDPMMKGAAFNLAAAGPSVGNGAIFYGVFAPLGAAMFIGPPVVAWLLVGAYFLFRTSNTDVSDTPDVA